MKKRTKELVTCKNIAPKAKYKGIIKMFRNRGEVPDVSPNEGGGGYGSPHYTHYWPRRFIIIRYDRKFLTIELIAVFIVLAIMFAAYLFGYSMGYYDPIESVKNNYLTAQMVLIGVTILATVLVTIFTKSSKDNLILILRLIAIASVLIIVVLFGVKKYIDGQYKNESVFAEFYQQYEKENDSGNKKLTVGLSGMKLQTEQQAYIESSMNSYNIFSIKSVIYMVLYIFLAMLIFYLAHRLAVIEDKKDEVTKNDDVLFDDEENVKF